jgi:formylglycine-generating enzyme required for sulfatase activity
VYHLVLAYVSKTLLILASLFTPIALTIGVLFLSHNGYFPVILWGRGPVGGYLFSGYCLLLLCVLLSVALVLWLVKKFPKQWRPAGRILNATSFLSLLVFAGFNSYVFNSVSFSPLFLYDPIIGFVDARKRGDDNNLSDEDKFGQRLRDYKLQKIARRFELSDKGYVLDKQQKLMWQRCALGQVWRSGVCIGDAETMEFKLAHRAATANEFAHYSDWRLPTRAELESIILCSDKALHSDAMVSEDCRLRYLPSVLPNAFPTGRRFWAATTAYTKEFAWVANLQHGGMEPRALDALAAAFLVRPVHDDEEYEMAVKSKDLASANSYLHHYPQGKHREIVLRAKRDFLLRNNSEVRSQGLNLATILKPSDLATASHLPTGLQPFAISTTEITFPLFDLYTREKGLPDVDDNNWGRKQRPVMNITFDQAVAFTQWLSEYTGETYRLPTLAEWQYAAGVKSTENKSAALNCTNANISPRNGQACSVGLNLPQGGTLPVGQYAPNQFGLHDANGNVAEWLSDCGDVNPAHDQCDSRLVIGGAWLSYPEDASVNSLQKTHPHRRGTDMGFRVVMPLH